MWESPREIKKLEDCYFYHTMDLPTYGTVVGEWDLRGKEDDYLGNTSTSEKKVLDVGTASGHMCFHMEKCGAEVVAYDLSGSCSWDIVPYANQDVSAQIKLRKSHIDLINNGFWFAHRTNGSKAKVVYGRVYDISENLGQFDMALVGSILLHLRDPFLALEKIAKVVSDTIVVTDVLPGQRNVFERLLPKFSFLQKNRSIKFLPNASSGKPLETWWNLNPHVVVEFLKVLGFCKIDISYHTQLGRLDQMKKMYTVVARRG